MSSSTTTTPTAAAALLLAEAWAKDFFVLDDRPTPGGEGGSSSNQQRTTIITNALARTIPLLLPSSESEGTEASQSSSSSQSSVPFVCRYRADMIHPLTTKQVHQLSDYVRKYHKLQTLRNRILNELPSSSSRGSGTNNDSDDEGSLLRRRRVATSISRTELEDLYAPFKPPPKGSLEDRIKEKHPELVRDVDAYWKTSAAAFLASTMSNDGSSNGGCRRRRRMDELVVRNDKLRPRDAAATLLANRIAGHPAAVDACLDLVERTCRIRVSEAKATTRATANKKNSQRQNNSGKTDNHNNHNASTASSSSSSTTSGFEAPLNRIRDHQVLAIRRGADRKILKLAFDVDGQRAERAVYGCLLSRNGGGAAAVLLLRDEDHRKLWKDAIRDAWSRLLRKRCTGRVWKRICNKADERSVDVFCENLGKALLRPPLVPPRPVLALDPGYKAGIKIAVLGANGEVKDKKDCLKTINFTKNRAVAKEELAKLLKLIVQQQQNKSQTSKVAVALGNGHGTNEARQLLREASEMSGVPVDVQLINEAGASVWSVTESASREFPDVPPASVAAVSIGRRYQDPLPELVKIPPRSLGLGMYQHDLPEAVLEDKLHVTSVDCVAEVGVDGNACSIEILCKVPGITRALAERIIQARPLASRKDLLKVKGLGPKSFENCAGFIRVRGEEPLDFSMVHPESYELARFLLDELQWDIQDASSVGALPSKDQRREKWRTLARDAASRFGVTEERVHCVIDQLHTSITNPDPRLLNRSDDDRPHSDGNSAGCSALPASLLSLAKLREACPVRNIRAHVRNVVDYGVFVDFGGENDALVHRSKLGDNVSLQSLLVGQEIGIDILGVSDDDRLRCSLSGLGFLAESTANGNSKKRGTGSNTQPTRHAPATKRQRTGGGRRAIHTHRR